MVGKSAPFHSASPAAGESDDVRMALIIILPARDFSGNPLKHHGPVGMLCHAL